MNKREYGQSDGGEMLTDICAFEHATGVLLREDIATWPYGVRTELNIIRALRKAEGNKDLRIGDIAILYMEHRLTRIKRIASELK